MCLLAFIICNPQNKTLSAACIVIFKISNQATKHPKILQKYIDSSYIDLGLKKGGAKSPPFLDAHIKFKIFFLRIQLASSNR